MTIVQDHLRLLSNTGKWWRCGNITKEEDRYLRRKGNWGVRNGRTKQLPGQVKSSLSHDSRSQFLLSVQEQAASPHAKIHILKKKGRKRKVRGAGGLDPRRNGSKEKG